MQGHINASVHIHTETRGQPWESFLATLSYVRFCWDRISYCPVNDQQTPEICLSQPDSQHGCYKCTTVYIMYLLFVGGRGGSSCKCESQSLCLAFLGGGPGIKLISSCLHSKLFTDWHIFPAQPLVFLSCGASLRTLTTVEYNHLYTVFSPSVLASSLYRTEVPVW